MDSLNNNNSIFPNKNTDNDIKFEEVPIEQITGKKNNKVITISKSAKRHVIALKEIYGFKNNYKEENIIKSNELIKENEIIESISIYSNEYIPEHFKNDKEYIEYILTVNYKNYKIIPINSYKNGNKIIKNNNIKTKDTYSIHINEKIKSAFLTIILRCPNKYETPFVSNIKIIKK